MFHRFSTYLMYQDIITDDDDDYDAKMITIHNVQIALCRRYEIRKDSQKYGQRPCKNF